MNKKFTPDEEERELLSKEPGKASWKENQRMAEEIYLKALSIDPSHGKTYKGLGQLFEKQGKSTEAVAAYQKYMGLEPNALDQQQIKQRIASLQRSTGQQ